MKQYHVVPRAGGRWAVKEARAKRATAVFDRKADAVSYGKKHAKAAKGQLVIHRADGQIETEHTYGPDPYPPRG